MQKTYKKYLSLVVTEDDYFFKSKDGDILRFAGGGDGRQKFIQQALIASYGKEGIDIFNKLLNAIDQFQETAPFGKNTGIFVLYPKINASNIE